MQTETLHSPLDFYLHNRRDGEPNGEYGMYDLHDERYKISQYEVTDQYADAVELAMRRNSDTLDKVHGLAEYLPEELQSKIHSIFPTARNYGSDMVCATEITLIKPLTPKEMADLKDWWAGQLADGWGKDIEQRGISVGYQGDELYMIPLSSGEDFYLDTEREFYQRMDIDYPDTVPPSMVAETTVPPQQLMEAKLYSPVFVDFWEHDEDGSYPTQSDEMSQETAKWFNIEISAAILKERKSEDGERGLMAYYGEIDSVNSKVRSIFLDVDVIDDKLWAVATLKLVEPLSEAELETLRDYMIGQYADGWGEGFEQRDIEIEGGDINVHLWKHSDEFFIANHEQLSQRLGITLPADVLSQPIPNLSPAQKALYEPDASDSEAVVTLREQLIDRIDDNLCEYITSLQGMSGKEIANRSSKVASMAVAHHYMTEIHNFHTSELNYLLQFKNPLELVSDEFEADGIGDRSFAMWRIFDRQEHDEYELMSDDPETQPTTVSTQEKGTKAISASAGLGSADKPSVIDEIRQSQKEARERPAMPKDNVLHEKAARKKAEPDL